jgi:hypothetical protein
MRKIVFLLLILLSGLVTYHEAKGATRIYIPVQFVVVNGDFSESMIYLRREGETVASFRGQKNLRLRLDFNTEYTIDFTKPGYITKTIRVNTKVEEDRKKYGFDPYKIGVRLFKQYEGVNTVIYNQPVASIRYLAEMDDFGYDTDYTKSILSALSRTEEILEKRAKDEIEEMEARAARDKAEMKAKKAIAATPIKNPEKIQVEEKVTESKAIEKSNDVLQEPKQDQAPTGLAGDDKTVVKPFPVAKGEESLGGFDKAGAEEMPATGGGDDGKEVQHVVLTETIGAEKSPEQIVPEIESGREIQKIIEPNRTITVFRIKNGTHIEEFRNVNYNWGGMFYFMNDATPISEHLFHYMTQKPPSR